MSIDMLSLVGGRIVDYDVVDNEHIGPIPAFVVQKANKYYQIEVLMDPEGNAGGHLDIIDITEEIKG